MQRFQIQNFKNLKDFDISDLKRVNLFTGRNNSGKSTLLEAISISAANANLQWLHKLITDRGETNQIPKNVVNFATNSQIIATLFNDRKIDLNGNSLIKLSTNNSNLSLGFVRYLEEGVYQTLDNQQVKVGINKIISKNDDNNSLIGFAIKTTSEFTIYPLNENLFLKYMNPKTRKIFSFINSSGNNYLSNAALWDKTTMSPVEDDLIEALKIIEPNISRLSFLGDESDKSQRYPVVRLKNEKTLPLKSMGDGINRILTIILALVNTENGYLLIDEFENGLHYSVQEKLWEIIIKISKKLNVQVFATTHSTDTINSFAKLLEQNTDHDGNLYRMANVNNKIKAYKFSKEDIIRAASQEINLR